MGNSGGSVSVDVSGDGGMDWTRLGTYFLNGTDTTSVAESFDISQYISPYTDIRFVASGTGIESYFYIDNVEIILCNCL